MASPSLISSLVSTLIWITVAAYEPYDVKIGLLLPHNEDSAIKYRMGFSTSAAAVTIALDRVQREQILPGANISFVWRFDQCDESLAAGHTVDLLQREQVDVIIGPPCSVPAEIVAVLAKYYNTPMMSWAATNIIEKDMERFNTLTRVIGSAYRIGRAMRELLAYFDWTRVAMLYTDDKATRKCLSVAQGAFKHFPPGGIHIVLFHEIDRERPTDEEIDLFLTQFPALTRIVLICIDADEDNRRFLLRAQERGLAGDEFVYIIPDYVRDENMSDIWTDRRDGVSDTRNVDSRRSMENVIFIEMQLGSNEDLWHFKQQIPKKMKEWPFYYNAGDIKNDQYYVQGSRDGHNTELSRRVSEEAKTQVGSLYSPFLHDSLYLYAIALNRSLEEGINKTDGRAIANRTANVQFLGMSGHVVIDSTMGREPSFVLKVFDKNGKLTPVLQAEMYKQDGQVVTLLVPEHTIWDNRFGYKPTWYPRCGWSGELCNDGIKQILPWIILGSIFGGVILVCVISGGLILFRRKLLADEMALMLWKINPRELERLVDMFSRDNSMLTVTTDVSEDVADIVLRGDERVVCFRGQLCWLKSHKTSVVLSSKEDHMQLKVLREITCENLNQFMGLCLDSGMPISVWKYCSKGSLQDVLLNHQIKLDWFFKYSLIKDLVNGMEYLHDTALKSHGHLKSSNCVVTNRWVLRITDFGLPGLRTNQDIPIASRLWTAPELLRMENPPAIGTQPGDVYSFSMILQEILARDMPFGSYGKAPQEIVNLVRAGLNPPFRPELSTRNDADMDPSMVTLMKDCWNEDPVARPDFKHIKGALKQMRRGKEGSLLDHALKMMEKYATNLETTITDRMRQLTEETKKADILLYKFLPKLIADRLKAGYSVEPESYDSVTIFFSDIAECEQIATRSSPLQFVSLLNDIYYLLDEILDDYDVFKIQTVNDVYLLAAGLHTSSGPGVPSRGPSIYSRGSASRAQSKDHAAVAADLALHFQLSMNNYIIPHLPKEKLQLRIGLHTGPIVAGVIGTHTPQFCLFGDTVNVANRILEYSKAGCIHISESTNCYLTEKIGGFITKPRGDVQVESVGTLSTFWLLGKKVKTIDDKTAMSAGGNTYKTLTSGSADSREKTLKD